MEVNQSTYLEDSELSDWEADGMEDADASPHYTPTAVVKIHGPPLMVPNLTDGDPDTASNTVPITLKHPPDSLLDIIKKGERLVIKNRAQVELAYKKLHGPFSLFITPSLLQNILT